jgi:hypothetical protein
MSIALKPLGLGLFDLFQVVERSPELQAMIERGNVRIHPAMLPDLVRPCKATWRAVRSRSASEHTPRSGLVRSSGRPGYIAAHRGQVRELVLIDPRAG